jgi:ADP-heptose:LPS heptosyltransferase
MRAAVATLALSRLAISAPWRWLRPRRPPPRPQRILVAHQLLLGDAILLSALLGALRERFPEATLFITCTRAQLPLYRARPWGVNALVLEERDVKTLARLVAAGPFDVVYLPAENRLSWLARAIGARWIVAFDNDRPAYKNWLVDERRPFSPTPIAWGDMVATLAGKMPRSFRADDWPAPTAAIFDAPRSPYCVLHVGASTPLKWWAPENWRTVARHLTANGFQIVLTSGANESELLHQVDPENQYTHYAGTLDLAQLWHLLHGGRLIVSLDCGVAHLARIAATPVVVLFGPGSAQLFGGGRFFASIPERKITVPNFPCRDENMIFRRHVAWAGNCGRSTRQCQNAKCMQGLEPAHVLRAVDELLTGTALGS